MKDMPRFISGKTILISYLPQLKYTKTYALTANAFKRTGYKFMGWNTEADGSGVHYDNKESVTAMYTPNGTTVILYAQWKRKEYTIDYVLNGSVRYPATLDNPVTSYNVDSNYIYPNTPVRTGYTFKGWYKDKDFKTPAYSIWSGSTGNKVFYAKWSINKYKIKFNGNGSTSGKMDSMSDRKYGTEYTLTKNAFKKTGYKFVGWNTEKDGTGTQYSNADDIVYYPATTGQTVTLYAQWQKK